MSEQTPHDTTADTPQGDEAPAALDSAGPEAPAPDTPAQIAALQEQIAAAQQMLEQALAAKEALEASQAEVAEPAEPDQPEAVDQAVDAGAANQPEPQATDLTAEDIPELARVSTDYVSRVSQTFNEAENTVVFGGFVGGDNPIPIGIPARTLNRHGLIGGATGTGKTKTVQVILESLSAAGIPTFAADIKGDLAGLAVPGKDNDHITWRSAAVGHNWQAQTFPSRYFALGGIGPGIPVRASIHGFGPVLLAKVLDLNETQESSLSLIFHYAENNGLALVDIPDLVAVLNYFTSDAGKAELKGLGNISGATIGVIVRKLLALSTRGADQFFGAPEFDIHDLMQVDVDGRATVNLLELASVFDQPELFSTFMMWLLAELYNELPEVGDTDKPKLVFFFDEAHLLFKDASKQFMTSVVQTVRLIRSKGVGVFFITQNPKDIPADVLGQLGHKVQHALRAHTPDEVKQLRAAVGAYPMSEYDLVQVLQNLPTGEAIVSTIDAKGVPNPVTWTRIRAPQSQMEALTGDEISALVQRDVMLEKYRDALDPYSAHEILAERLNVAASQQISDTQKDLAEEFAKEEAARQQAEEKRQREFLKEIEKERLRAEKEQLKANQKRQQFMEKQAQTLVREVVRGIFGTRRR